MKNIFTNKKILIFIFCLFLSLGFVHFASAQISNYQPLTSIPGAPAGQATSAGDYLAALYRFGVGLAILLALIMIILGGAQYMTSEVLFGKEEGRKKITQAVIGLLLALGSYLILYTLGGTKLVNFQLKLTKPTYRLEGTTPTTQTQTTTQTPSPYANMTATEYQQYLSAEQKLAQGQALTPAEQAVVSKAQTSVDNTKASSATATYNGLAVTNFGGKEDSRTDANGNVVNKNGGTTWNETASVATSIKGSTVYLRDFNPATQYYSAYPLASRTPDGLLVVPDTGAGNKTLGNYYLQVYNPTTGKRVNTEIIDRGPGNDKASLDVSRATTDYAGSGQYQVSLVPKTGNTVGPVK